MMQDIQQHYDLLKSLTLAGKKICNRVTDEKTYCCCQKRQPQTSSKYCCIAKHVGKIAECESTFTCCESIYNNDYNRGDNKKCHPYNVGD